MSTSLQDQDQLTQLAETLWYERRLLEFLLFKLVSANLVLATDDRRFVGPAIAEVEKVVTEVREAERARYDVLTKVATTMGVPMATITLNSLADTAPEDLRGVFADHRDAFMALANEIEEITTDNRRLASVGLDGITGTLQLAAGMPGAAAGTQSYTSQGRSVSSAQNPTRVDQVL